MVQDRSGGGGRPLSALANAGVRRAAAALILALAVAGCDDGVEPTDDPVGSYEMVRANDSALPKAVGSFTVLEGELFVQAGGTYRMTLRLSGTTGRFGAALGTYVIDDGVVRFTPNEPAPDGSSGKFSGRLDGGILSVSFGDDVRFEYEPCVVVETRCS